MQEMQETWVLALGWEDSLEEEMATLSSILARIIPWSEEPVSLSTGSQKRWTRQKGLSMHAYETSLKNSSPIHSGVHPCRVDNTE